MEKPPSKTSRQRLIFVYNPRSSGFQKVDAEVLTPLRARKNLTLLKFEVQPTDVDDNAMHLAEIIEPGDKVLVAGGDGTATIALNGVMLSGEPATLAVLGYGNFNDFARMLGFYDFAFVVQNFLQNPAENLQNPPCFRKIYPLEILVNGEHWRYASSYLTAGLFAESTRVFDEPKTREFLQKHGKNLFFSLSALAKWYFHNKSRDFLPTFTVNSAPVKPKTTDLMAVNSPTMAKLMHGGRFYLSNSDFLVATARLGSFCRLCAFMAKSVCARVPGKIHHGPVKIAFKTPADLELQAEGEYRKFTCVRAIEIRKATGILCLTKN